MTGRLRHLFLILFLPLAAHAGGDDLTAIAKAETSVNTGDLIGGDTNVSTGASRALGVGNALGDVDIDQCLGSEQWYLLVYGKQRLVINWPCMAEFYYRTGQMQLVGFALCNHPEMAAAFDDRQTCLDAHTFAAPAGNDHLAELIERVADLERLLAATEREHETQIGALSDQVTEFRETRAEVVQRFAKPAPPPQQGITDEQRAALAEIFENDGIDSE